MAGGGLNPSGLCQCGCGEMTPIAKYHRKQDGIEKGQHVRFIKGHFARTQRLDVQPPNPSGLCMCGCGQPTPLAKRTRVDGGGRTGVKGHPVCYLAGHHRNGVRALIEEGPNPSGLCMCGCGRKTSLAKSTARDRGQIRGTPMRYLKGHDKRGKRFPPHGKRLEQIRMARERHLRVVEDYQRGLSLDRIAERHGFAGAASVGWVIARARARGEVIARRNRVPAPSLDGATVRRLVRMWRRGATASEMRQVFGWSRAELGSAVQSARKDFDLPMRAARPSQFTPDERRVLKRKAVKIKPQGDLTDRQRTVLRLLQASSEPVAGGALAEIMCLLGYTYSPGRVYSVLDQMRRKRLLARAESRARYRHAPKWVWFVPLDREQPAVTLTLDDAKRESELAALIREQEQEAARGHWAEIDPKTLSMDAEFSEDGGSWHDILVADEDDPFKASVATR